MAMQLALLDACFSKAAEGAKLALQKSIDDAITALQIAQTQSVKIAERDLLTTACKGLVDFRTIWVDGYEQHLSAEFEATKSVLSGGGVEPAIARTPNRPSPPLGSEDTVGSRFGELSLVDDQQVSQAIESARLLQQMLPHIEQSLPELDKLISTAQGFTRVYPELNPLRPEVFAKSLLDLLYGVAATPAVTALWIKNLGGPLGRELSSVYDSVVNLLELSDIRAASYQVVQTPNGRSTERSAALTATAKLPPSRGAGADPGSSDASQRHGLDDLNFGALGPWPTEPSSTEAVGTSPWVDAALFQDFVLHGGGQAGQPLSAATREQLQAEYAALSQAARADTQDSAAVRLYQAGHTDPTGSAGAEQARFVGAPSSGFQSLPSVDRPPRTVSEDTALNSRFWGTLAQPQARAMARSRLKAQASEVGQVMGLEVVRQLVHEVAQDARLLAPVRESIVALEPALGRLALQDPRFFGDEKHPGRLLMERVAQRSFKYNDEFSPEFGAFFKPLTQIVNALNGEGTVDAHRFDTALLALENEWAVLDKAEAARRREVLEKMRFAEARQTQADEIAYELSTRSDLEDVPGMVLDFLFGHWSLAMAHARLCDTRNQLDPEGLGSAVPDLVWSAKPKATIRQPAKLIEMIPGLLGKLHSGLQMLGTDAEECAPFFDGLMKLHQPVLKLRRIKSQRDARESSHAQLSVSPSLMDEISNAESAPATAEQRRAKVAATPWLGKHELLDAGFQDTLPTDYGDLVVQTPERHATEAPVQRPPDGHDADADDAVKEHAPSNAHPAPDASTALTEPGADATAGDATDVLSPTVQSAAEALLLALRAGDWVDLYSRRRWLRAQLTWASTKGTLFMFVSHGGQPHSMTKRSCERLIASRLLRPVKSHGVVSHALQAVAANAQALPSASRVLHAR
jgi:Protein of unknown function (DUF1631)